MKRVTGLLILAAITALQGIAVAAPPSPVAAIRSLAAHGLIDGYVPGRTLTPPEAAILTARAISKVEAGGATKGDLSALQSLIDTYPVELDALGVRDTNIAAARASLAARTQRATAEFGPSRAIENSAVTAAPNAPPAAVAGVVSFAPATATIADGLAGITFTAFRSASRARIPAVSRIGALAFSAVPAGPAGLSTLEPADYRDKVALFSQDAPEAYVRFAARGAVRPEQVVSAGGGLSYSHLFGNGAQLVALRAPAAGYSLIAANVFGLAPATSSSPSRTGVAAPVRAVAMNTAAPPLVAGITFHAHAVSAALQDFSNSSAAAPLTMPTPQFTTNAQTGFATGALAGQPQFSPQSTSTAYASTGFNPFDDSRASFSAGLAPANRGLDIALSVPLRIGGAVLHNTVGAAHAQEFAPPSFGAPADCTGATSASCPYFPSVAATEDRFSAGTSFDVRAMGRPIAVNLSASLAHLSRNDQTAFVVPPDVSLQSQSLAALSGAGALSPTTFNPNFVDITRRSLGAGAAVPLSPDLSLNLQYAAQYYTGSYSTLGQNINSRKDLYLGNLTYTIPRTASAITFSAKQYRYRDAFVPTYNQMQNRADLNFTVKF